MKRILALILALLTVLPLAACGEFYTPLDPPANNNGEGGGGDSTDPGSDVTDLVNDPTAFTVSLRIDGQPYVPPSDSGMKAQWSDGYHVYTADFASDGKARVAELDGDYRVTLIGLPEPFVYNSNAYTARKTETGRHVVIDVYVPLKIYEPVKKVFAKEDLYMSNGVCMRLSDVGVYRVKLTDSDHLAIFEYAPQVAGTYTIESWVSTADGQYNPKLDVYQGGSAYKIFAYTLDNGGTCEGYTQNFKHTVEIAEEHISQSGTGSATFTFAMHVDSKNELFPVYIDFAVQLNGGFSLSHENKEVIIPTDTMISTPDYDSLTYDFKWAETNINGAEGRKKYDGEMFALFPKGTGMPLKRPEGVVVGTTPAEILKGQYYMLYKNADADLSRVINFTPDGAGATTGSVEILDYYFTTVGEERKKGEMPRFAGTYRYAYDAATGKVTLTHTKGDQIDYAAFNIRGGSLTYGEGDNFYHLVDKENGTYGAILYAKISSPHRFTELPFTNIEDPGNASLTVNGWENHKLFIQGLLDLLVDELEYNPRGKGPYFCIHGCPCREDGTGIGVCAPSCTKCDEGCRHLPEDVMEALFIGVYYCDAACSCQTTHTHGVCGSDCTTCTDKCQKMPQFCKDILDAYYSGMVIPAILNVNESQALIQDIQGRWVLVDNRILGYANYTNSDGVYAVTEDIRHFLQSFSISQRYFADGQGWVETHPTYKVYAVEDDQWLFACGYYVRR